MRKTVAAFAVAAMADGAFAQSVNVNIGNVPSVNGQGDPANIVLLVNLGVPNAEVTGIDWNFAFLPVGASWTAEAHMTFGDSGGSNAYDWDMGNWGGANNSIPVSLNGTDTTASSSHLAPRVSPHTSQGADGGPTTHKTPLPPAPKRLPHTCLTLQQVK